ncbi:MAG: hypothetical protein ACE5FP_00320 [Gemmatimonadota bacterium]
MAGDLDRWLEPRLAGAPRELAEAVRALLRESAADSRESSSDVPEVLAAAAMRGFDGVLSQADPPREAALRLLAADAALTYAFEAAAALGRDVDALALRMGPSGELGRRLESQRPGPAAGGAP